MSDSFDIDQLEADLGVSARLTVLANVGGQRRHVPLPANAIGSKLAGEVGDEVAIWLAARFGGDQVVFPSARGRAAEDAANALRAAVIDAGLIEPTRSANDIAREFGVSENWVYKLRGQLRDELDDSQPSLFD